jgi:hypothetical protein
MPTISQAGRPERKVLRGALLQQYDDQQALA